MKTYKAHLKKRLCRKHREERYEHAIGKVMDGEAEPEYATKRWQKLKQVKQ